MKRALVTGASGMLGSYLVELLHAEGWYVRGMVRRPDEALWLRGLGADLVQGDLNDAASVCRAMEGCVAVFHAAAEIGSGGDWHAFKAGNVGGTRAVVDAAAAAGARLVHVSTTAVFGAARYRSQPTDEEVPLPNLPSGDVYGRSKQQAEFQVLDAHREGRLWATVVRPPVMYGRRDRQFAPRIGPVLKRGLFPLIGGGLATLNLVHASSVALGAVRALENEVAGGRVFHLTDDFPVTVAELVRRAAEGLGIGVRAPVVPLWLGRAGFRALAVGLWLAGRGDLATHADGTLRMLTRDNPFSSERARRELGWTPTVRPEVGLPEAFAWWASHQDGPGVVATSRKEECRERALG